MEQKVCQKWSVGSIVLLCLYALGCLKSIGIIQGHRAFIKIFAEFNMELPALTMFFIKYGPVFTMFILAGTFIFILREFLTKKIIALRVSVISFLIILVWNLLYVVSYFLPLFRLASLSK